MTMNTTITKPLYTILASSLAALKMCERQGNPGGWVPRHTNRLRHMVRNWLPSGSGFDAGTTLDLEASTPERLVFLTSFHHMDDNGGYCGWSDHKVTITPSFMTGFDLKVTGPNKSDIKDYVASAFHDALEGKYDERYLMANADNAA